MYFTYYTFNFYTNRTFLQVPALCICWREDARLVIQHSIKLLSANIPTKTCLCFKYNQCHSFKKCLNRLCQPGLTSDEVKKIVYYIKVDEVKMIKWWSDHLSAREPYSQGSFRSVCPGRRQDRFPTPGVWKLVVLVADDPGEAGGWWRWWILDYWVVIRRWKVCMTTAWKN